MDTEDQLSPDEIVFRRIPEALNWVKNGKVDPAAFLPNKGDSEGGISLARVASARDAAATGRAGKTFYAVPLRIGDMQRIGLVIKADAPSHAFIEGWVQTRRAALEELAERLCTICGPAEGPFDGGKLDPSHNL